LLAVWLGSLQVILDKGQEDDWFGAVWIRWAAGILVVSFVVFLVWEWFGRKPLVDLRIFKNRNFALGCLLIGLFGASIYGMITLLPLFYQELMGYTAQVAGIAVSPRGIGAICAMPIIGILTARMDNRWLIGAGFTIFAICSLWFGEVYLGISQWSFLWAIVLSGFGSGMVFVPLSTTAMGTLKNEQIGNASGLYNLLRNVGGSIGISIVNTIVARHEQLHRSELVHSLQATNPATEDRLSFLQNYVANHQALGPAGSRNAALQMLDNTLHTQARLWAYVDDFRYLALACFACVPIVFFFKRARPRAGAIHAE
ncbi:MAG: MFS transporter, partial [Acidobacteriaceae bacterium]|nr:MFS transporter [Acidobacteriaceae bacterium]